MPQTRAAGFMDPSTSTAPPAAEGNVPVPRHPVVRPVEKKDGTDIVQYLEYFKRIIKVNSWSDEEAGDIFVALLGQSDKSTEGLTWTSFTDLEAKLKAKDQPLREAHLAKLMALERKDGESASELRDRTVHLVNLVYPTVSPDGREKIVRDFYLYSLPSQLRQRILLGMPVSLEEVVALTASLVELDIVAASKSISMVDEPPGEVNAVGTFRQPRRNREDIPECWFCHKRGHVQRDCYRRQKAAHSQGNAAGLFLLGEEQSTPSAPKEEMGDSS